MTTLPSENLLYKWKETKDVLRYSGVVKDSTGTWYQFYNVDDKSKRTCLELLLSELQNLKVISEDEL